MQLWAELTEAELTEAELTIAQNVLNIFCIACLFVAFSTIPWPGKCSDILCTVLIGPKLL
jgi:hypothetical protein